jgi:alanine-glyoxylate transaminase / serine-glyoxylate transaminase / serine-pyruvate transaminase
MKNPIIGELDTSPRILLGPGPSMVPPRVLRSMTMPLLGHLDPEFLQVMDEEQSLLRFVFQTENELTLAIPGTGSAGMEAALSNFIEPGDQVLVAVIGFFGERLAEMASRYGAEVDRLERSWGEIFDPVQIEQALKKKRYKLLALVHAETSTGALQSGIPEITSAAHRNGALVVLDTVTSLGGLPVEIDRWDVDIAYSAAQKSLSCPPGLAPLTVSKRAREVMVNRKTPVANWYLDLNGLEKYWGETRAYHHTAPISTHFALREGLRIMVEEGLEARFARHRAHAELLWDGLEALDLPPLIPYAHRLATLTTPQLYPSIDDVAVRRRLLEDYNIEIAGGFGPLKGKVWRIGLMGFSSRKENVTLLMAALDNILRNT